MAPEYLCDELRRVYSRYQFKAKTEIVVNVCTGRIVNAVVHCWQWRQLRGSWGTADPPKKVKKLLSQW